MRGVNSLARKGAKQRFAACAGRGPVGDKSGSPRPLLTKVAQGEPRVSLTQGSRGLTRLKAVSP